MKHVLLKYITKMYEAWFYEGTPEEATIAETIAAGKASPQLLYYRNAVDRVRDLIGGV